MCTGTLRGVPIFSRFTLQSPPPLFECIQSTPQLWFSLMLLISPVYWNEGKRQRGRSFACLWRIKEAHPLTWEVIISRIASMLMGSNDCGGFFESYKTSWQRWIKRNLKVFLIVCATEAPWFHLLPQNCMRRAHATSSGLPASSRWRTEVCADFLMLWCFTKDPFITSFWLPLARRSCGKG